jgi:hypothetical protein
MNETLVSDLVALVRRSVDDPDRAIPRAPWVGGIDAAPSVLLELERLARRARTFGATDEEISLSIGVLLATSPAPAVPP